MKKLHAVVIFFVVGLIGAALWFSPLCSIGTPVAYDNNMPVCELDGLCYPSDSICRVDFSGGSEDMYKALKKIDAKTVKQAEASDGMIIVYAYSPRVCAATQRLSSGQEYNVMASYSSGNICIGTPLLSGCY